ncbi:hypothetical protein C7S20_08355 [Christiangramia fulva]|uniref:Glycosyl transferase n=1 Tax=Christiangramia fulva TaxID=2126553 RepID=A0A2R3Z4T5_9FLAO|nr:hypothetical protein [Christiangramia fulva]AVR45275.1 hypothetical protein C7S20_08355 [Christiangramia fulva]
MSKQFATLLGKRNLEFSITCLKSFLYHCQDTIDLTIYEDGTLDAEAAERLSQELPGCKISFKKNRNEVVKEKLQNFPLSNKYREFSPLALKLLDVALTEEGDHLLFLDSDIFFINDFTIGDLPALPAFMRDSRNAYSFGLAECKNFPSIYPRINTGFFYFPLKFFSLEMIEEVLERKILNKTIYQICWLEQTLWALLAGKNDQVLYFNDSKLVMAGEKINLGQEAVGVHLVSTYRHQLNLVMQAKKELPRDITIELDFFSEKKHLSLKEFYWEKVSGGLLKRIRN